MTARKWASELVPTAFLLGACFVVPGAGVAIGLVASVATAVAPNSTDQALGWVKRRLSGNPNDAINYDLEHAMKRGYVRAIDFLGDIWQKSHQRDTNSPQEADPAELFRWLRDDVDELLSVSRLNAFLANAESIQSFGKRDQARHLEAFLQPYVYGRTDELGTFLKRSLVSHIAIFFGEELKIDTRAWRAFQRVVTDSLLAGFHRLEAGQARQHAETKAKLEELLKRFDATPPEQPMNEGLDGLEREITKLRDEVKAAIEAEGRLTREAIELSYDLLTLQATQQHVAVVGKLTEINRNIERLVGSQGIEPVSEARGKILEFGGRRRNRFFVGRDELQGWIEQRFAEIDSGSGAAIVLHGLGGTGKTQLALEYASRRQDRYAGIWWMLAESENSLVSGYGDLATRLDLPASRIGDPQLAADAARRYLEERGPDDRWLLILDNANDIDSIDRWLPVRGAVDALVTSRLSNWDGDRSFHPKRVDVLAAAEAIDLLVSRTGDQDTASASGLAEELGYLPLALEQAAAFIRAMPQVRSLAGYLRLYRSDPGRALAHHRPKTGEYLDTVASTWSITISAVEDELVEARVLMNLLSFLAPDVIPLDLIIANAGDLPDRLGNALTDPELRVIEVLVRYSLVSLSPTGDLSIHRLVQMVTRVALEPHHLEIEIAQAVRLVESLFSFDAGAFENWPMAARLVPHAIETLKFAKAVDALMLDRATLSFKLGSFYSSQGELPGARAMYEESLALRRRITDEEHLDIATGLNNLAHVMSLQGDLVGARAHYEDVLARYQRVLPMDHPAIAMSLNNLAHVMSLQGDLVGARARYEDALARYQRVLPAQHIDIATSLNNLAHVMSLQGDLVGARAHYEDALARYQRVLSTDHPLIATCLSNLGAVFESQGDLAGARRLFEQALERHQRVLPVDHPDIAVSLNNLAYVLSLQGELAEARKLLEEALVLYRRMLPEGHPNITKSLLSLAHVLLSQGQFVEARKLYEETLERYQQIVPEELSITVIDVSSSNTPIEF